MNNHYSMSDLYLTERSNMPDIINLFKKLDYKLNPKIIKFKKIKNNKINESSGKEKNALSHTNIMDNNISNNVTVKNNNNLNLSGDNRIIYERKNLRNKTINYNIQKIKFFKFNNRSNIKRKSYNGNNINFFINQTINHSKKTIRDNNIKDNVSNNSKEHLNSKNILLKSIQSNSNQNNISNIF